MSTKHTNHREQKGTPNPMVKDMILAKKDHAHSDKRDRRPNQGIKSWRNENWG